MSNSRWLCPSFQQSLVTNPNVNFNRCTCKTENFFSLSFAFFFVPHMSNHSVWCNKPNKLGFVCFCFYLCDCSLNNTFFLISQAEASSHLDEWHSTYKLLNFHILQASLSLFFFYDRHSTCQQIVNNYCWLQIHLIA